LALHTRPRSELQQRREGWRKGEKREGKKGRERESILEMREGKKRKIKKWGRTGYNFFIQ
jgi:hypothetical protein